MTLADDLERARAAWQQLGADLRAALAPPLRRLLEWLEPPQTARNRAEADARIRSAALSCRCGDRQDEHLPYSEGGCTLCPCAGFALTAREELDLRARSLEPGAYPIAPFSPIGAGGTLYVTPSPAADEEWTPPGLRPLLSRAVDSQGRRLFPEPPSGHGASEGDPDL